MNNSVPIKARKSTSSRVPLAVRLSRRRTLQGLTIPPRRDYKYATSLTLFIVMCGALTVNIAGLMTAGNTYLHAHPFARLSVAPGPIVTPGPAEPEMSAGSTSGTGVTLPGDTGQAGTTDSTDTNNSGEATPDEPQIPVVEPTSTPTPTPIEPVAPAPAVPLPVPVQQPSPKVTSAKQPAPQIAAPVTSYYYSVPDTLTTVEPEANAEASVSAPVVAQMASAQAFEATSPVTYTSARISDSTRDRLLLTSGIAILASIAMYILATLSNPTNTPRFGNRLRVRPTAREVLRS